MSGLGQAVHSCWTPCGVTGWTCKGCPTLKHNWNLSCIVPGDLPKVTQVGVAFITHRDSGQLFSVPAGLQTQQTLLISLKAGSASCTPSLLFLVLAEACPLLLPSPFFSLPLPSCLLHRKSQLHQPSSCHPASCLCPLLSGKARVPAELERTDSPWWAKRMGGGSGEFGQAPNFSAVLGSRFH